MHSSQEHSAGAGKWLVLLTPSIVPACAPWRSAQWGAETETKKRQQDRSKRKNRIWLILPNLLLPPPHHHVLMWKLDNKIRTCLPALRGTYQYRNLIPESLSPLPYFRAFTIDLITGLSDEAPDNRPGWRGAAFDRATHKARSHRCSRGTKDPLCQHWGSGGGHSAAGNSDPNRQHQNGHSIFPNRYTVSEQLHRPAAHGLSNHPHCLLENVIKLEKNSSTRGGLRFSTDISRQCRLGGWVGYFFFCYVIYYTITIFFRC